MGDITGVEQDILDSHKFETEEKPKFQEKLNQFMEKLQAHNQRNDILNTLQGINRITPAPSADIPNGGATYTQPVAPIPVAPIVGGTPDPNAGGGIDNGTRFGRDFGKIIAGVSPNAVSNATSGPQTVNPITGQLNSTPAEIHNMQEQELYGTAQQQKEAADELKQATGGKATTAQQAMAGKLYSDQEASDIADKIKSGNFSTNDIKLWFRGRGAETGKNLLAIINHLPADWNLRGFEQAANYEALPSTINYHTQLDTGRGELTALKQASDEFTRLNSTTAINKWLGKGETLMGGIAPATYNAYVHETKRTFANVLTAVGYAPQADAETAMDKMIPDNITPDQLAAVSHSLKNILDIRENAIDRRGIKGFLANPTSMTPPNMVQSPVANTNIMPTGGATSNTQKTPRKSLDEIFK